MLHVSERNKKSANISDFEFTNIGISVKNPKLVATAGPHICL